jgi:RimJ/RimL family protein N-acetyltransferase
MNEYFLHTERIGFSTWSENDMPDAMELWGDTDVAKFITAEGRMTEDQVRQRIAKEIETFSDHGIQYWPICLTETGRHIGCCGLRPYDPEKNILEMGIHLKKECWGRGLAQEACRAVMRYAFITLKADGIFAGHNPANTGSAGLLKKLNFRYTHNEFYQPTGLLHPSYLITREEYAGIDGCGKGTEK